MPLLVIWEKTFSNASKEIRSGITNLFHLQLTITSQRKRNKFFVVSCMSVLLGFHEIAVALLSDANSKFRIISKVKMQKENERNTSYGKIFKYT